MSGISKSDPNGKPDYIPWNEDEFYADINVRGLSTIQKWMYRTLLQNAFFCPSRPYLPDNDDMLWILAGCESKQQWDENKEAIRKIFFSVRKDGKKLLAQKRLLSDWNALVNRRLEYIERARKGGEARSKQQASLKQAEAALI